MKLELNKIYNGDALELLKFIPNNSIDLVVTDPPYKITSRGNSGDTGGMLAKDLSKRGLIFKHNAIDIEDWIDDVYRVLKEGSHCYIMTNNKNLKHYLNVIENAKFKIFKTLIWKKDNCITNMFYMDTHEYIIFCRKGKAKRINNCGTKSVLDFSNKKMKDENGNNLHDTEKPVSLLSVLIANSSNEGEIVLDPFMGIGGVPVACKSLNRKYIGMEIDPNYYNISLSRLNEVQQPSARKRLIKKVK